MVGDLRVSQRAQRQLLEITRYTRLTFGPKQAEKLADGFRNLFDLMRNFPLSWPAEPGSPPLRRAVLHPFIVLYQASEKEVLVIAILHGARDRE